VELTKDRAVTEPKPIGPHSFPRRARLLKPVDYTRVFKNSIASSDRYFRVLASPNGLTYSRLGLAVSRKVDRRAVGRNRIKRVVRESFRHAFETIGRRPASSDNRTPCPEGIDLVVLPRPVCATICNGQLVESLDLHWSRLKKSTGRTRVKDNRESPAPGAMSAD
jgi:ribonuclease P protein component